VCIASSTFGITTTTCMATCPVGGIGTQSTCRAGYLCAPTPLSSVQAGQCRPPCTNGGLAGCVTPAVCDANSGLCQ
jgi:hypothetical protein